jgi:dTDP-glucose 4,6-dehydratase
MRLLVTGGAGFIGSNFIRYILDTYPTYYVVNYDLLTYAGNLDSLRDVEPKQAYKFVKGDIVDKARVLEVVKENDITHIVNFAAESHVDRSVEGPSAFVRTNVIGTQVLLEVAKEEGIERFHHISTDEVFGSLDLKSRNKFTNDTPYDPKSPYSASKAASDHIARAYFETFGLPVTITNCSNNFGPYQSPEKFLPRMITNLIDGKKLPIYGDGKYVRDWLHVDDHCRAIDLALHKGKVGETFLVGGMKKDVSNLEIAEKLLEIFNRSRDHIEFVKDRPGHDRRYAVDWSKINKELGWEPVSDFDEWLVDTVEWYKDNEWWWRPQKKEAEGFYKNKLGYGALEEDE